MCAPVGNKNIVINFLIDMVKKKHGAEEPHNSKATNTYKRDSLV
jgi:hypothetical protein